MHEILYNGKLAQRKTFANFAFCWASMNLLLWNISFNAYFIVSVSDGIRKCFLASDLLMANSQMFSFTPISCYTVFINRPHWDNYMDSQTSCGGLQFYGSTEKARETLACITNSWKQNFWKVTQRARFLGYRICYTDTEVEPFRIGNYFKNKFYNFHGYINFSPALQNMLQR